MKFTDDSFVTKLEELLKLHKRVRVVGLGIFELRRIPERIGYSVEYKKKVPVPAHNKIAFQPSKNFKASIQGVELEEK